MENRRGTFWWEKTPEKHKRGTVWHVQLCKERDLVVGRPSAWEACIITTGAVNKLNSKSGRYVYILWSDETRRERLKSALYLRLKKRKRFKNMLRTVFMENWQKVSKHTKGAFSAQKTLQKFGYSVLRQIRALFSILRLLVSKTQYSSDIMSKILIYRNIFEPLPPKFG